MIIKLLKKSCAIFAIVLSAFVLHSCGEGDEPTPEEQTEDVTQNENKEPGPLNQATLSIVDSNRNYNPPACYYYYEDLKIDEDCTLSLFLSHFDNGKLSGILGPSYFTDESGTTRSKGKIYCVGAFVKLETITEAPADDSDKWKSSAPYPIEGVYMVGGYIVKTLSGKYYRLTLDWNTDASVNVIYQSFVPSNL